MGCYFKKGKGWRYDFIHRGNRFTGAWFRTKADAMREMAQKKEEVTTPRKNQEAQEAQTDMDFLEVINRRLDYVKAYHSATHYRDYVYMAKRWAHLWGHLKCDQITQDMVEQYLCKRQKRRIYRCPQLSISNGLTERRSLLWESGSGRVSWRPSGDIGGGRSRLGVKAA